MSLTRHPESNQRLTGHQVPLFAEAVRIAIATAMCAPLGYVGIDIVIDAFLGPLVLEINARPGLEIQNVTGIGLGTVLSGVIQ